MMPLVEVTIEDQRWNQFALKDCARQACAAALREAANGSPGGEISVLACSDERIAELNFRYRGKHGPTNVLSWPRASQDAVWRPSEDSLGPPGIGDIALAWETCAAEAESLTHGFGAHIAHLLVHGSLHLLGFSHGNDKEAEEMRRMEIRALASIGIGSPYDDAEGR